MLELSGEHLKDLKCVLKKHVPKCTIRLFGSRVNGNAKPYSDLDIAIISNDKLDLQILGDLKEELEESNIPFRIDIIDWHRISKSFQEIINKKYTELDI